ncbi:nucleoporin-interacting protein [Geobacillus thermoleovorans]|uniref:nucleoporin-interacting protein n=1 Tax=Geobacillus thermoleovorans TaxID=33941 RepID=UPI002056A27C|nr:nucleoporin-interacting protein [Geobacillus thermoleovorans]UPT60231.1 nucleoporin-interacting protein [Geobacillus thermoleovorans]
MNKRFGDRFWIGFGVGTASLLVGACLYWASPYAATWDEVDFALALRRYDVLAMQPHFPGYPYLILGGMAVHALVANPAKALSILNVLVLFSAAFPIVLLLARHMPRPAALWAALSVLSSSYVLLASARPMSDGAALGVLWWYIWAVEWARRRMAWTAQLLPMALFSILMGVRLSYIPFASALLLLWHEDWKTHRRLGRVAASLLAAAAFQFVWVAAVAATEGGLWPFFKLGFAFVVGHFSDWGGTAAASPLPFWERVCRFVLDNFLWTGMASRNAWLLAAYAVVGAIAWRTGPFRLPRPLVVSALLYALWALFGQNIDKPRHLLPLVHIALVFVWGRVLAAPRSWKHVLAAAVVLLQSTIGIGQLCEQAKTPPAVYQLADDLRDKRQPFVVYTWEETRVLDYLNVPFPHKDVLHFSFFLQDKENYRHAAIYMTNHVVQGFEAQGIDVSRHVRKVKTYRSSLLADPVYGTITLYEWVDGAVR